MSNSQFSTLNSQLSKLAVFASGSGSNFEAIAQACVDGRVPAKIVLLVCDNANAYAIERAKKFDIPTLVLHPRDCGGKAAYEHDMEATPSQMVSHLP